MNIVVCDNEEIWVEKISDLVRNNIDNRKDTLYPFSTQEEVLHVANSVTFDIAYIDIELSDGDGITLAKQLLIKNPSMIIFFITSHDQYVTDAFQISAFQYLRKPIDPDLFEREYKRALHYHQRNNVKFKIKERGITHSLKPKDIVYVESYYRKVYVATTKNKFRTTASFALLKSLLLSSHDFVATHQSYIVNLHHVQSIDKEYVHLSMNDEKIPISPYKYAQVVQGLNRYLND